MFFDKDNKVDEVAKSVVEAIRKNRFNFARYSKPNKFKGVVTEVMDDYTVVVYKADGEIAHTVNWREKAGNINKREVFIDGVEISKAYESDSKEMLKRRQDIVTPLLGQIEKRLYEIVDSIVEGNGDFFEHTANLLEYCASPRRTAIGEAHSYNRGHIVSLLMNHLKTYAMHCDEENGLHTMKQVVEMINSKKM